MQYLLSSAKVDITSKGEPHRKDKIMALSKEDIAKITTAPNVQSALRITGEIDGQAHHNRIDYIHEIMGSRATGGYFSPTRANVTAKFAVAYELANA